MAAAAAAAGRALPVLLALLACALAAGAEAGAATRGTADLTRRELGDSFVLTGGVCGAEVCAEHAAVTAAGGAAGEATGEAAGCSCACPPRAPLYREDHALCVDDISECSLASFGTGSSAQKMPFVFLPLKGQIIHPARDITFAGVRTPICAVSGAQFLTQRGFLDLRNTIDADVPFTLFRDEGRTFLQWSGEPELRTRMSGRVMLVRLLCRDVWAAPAASAAPAAASVDLRGVFTPCVAFRVQGSPAHHVTNVSEVQFALNVPTSDAVAAAGLSVSEYIAIGISSVLLGLIYVASVFLYLHIRRRRKNRRDEENDRRKTLKGLKNKDGTSIRDHDIVRINNDRVQSLPTTLDRAEDGIVKSNPLLIMNRQFHDLKNSFSADAGSSFSDSEDQREHGNGNEEKRRQKKQSTSAVVHPCARSEARMRSDPFHEAVLHRDESGIERLPDEHVSIVETTDTRDDRSDIVRPIGSTRRKLYFNPAYFEPQLMAEPPPAALEFLTKIREVITIAKHKMSAKRFQPVLNEIPEEETYQSVQPSLEFYQGLGSQRSGSVISLKRENSRKRPISCVGCPGCKAQSYGDIENNLTSYDVPACTNCLNKSRGDKQNSIRKWLDEIPLQPSTLYNDIQTKNIQNTGLLKSLLSLPTNDCKHKLRKQCSFSQSLCAEDVKDNYSFKKKTSTCSVRSEPIIRNYNFPLPDFDYVEGFHKTIDALTVSRNDNINRTGFGNEIKSERAKPLANQRNNKLITSKRSLPDMVSEAIAIDGTKLFNHSSSDDEKIYDRSRVDPVTTRHFSESPQGIDYETDSLERNSMNKGFSTPTEYADVPSSQASPSLSAALPLEEEVTMRNAVYKTNSSSGKSNTPPPNINGHDQNNLYETIGEVRASHLGDLNKVTNKKELQLRATDDYSLVSEVYVNNYNFGSPPTSPSGSECSMGSRKSKKEPEKPGCLTIVVQDPPENYIKIHESDGFEPDTLDRKHPRCKEILESIQFSRKDLLNNIRDIETNSSSQTIKLKSNGTFGRSAATPTLIIKPNDNQFNSLREIYENRNNTFTRPKLTSELFFDAKNPDESFDQNCEETIEWTTEEGRILTLELRHSKRQRQCTPPSIKQLKGLVRPDVLPPLPPVSANTDADDEHTHIYQQPSSPPRRVHSDSCPPNVPPKNVNGRSLSPKSSTNHLMTNSNFQSMCSHPHIGPACSPSRASVQTQYSDYENANSVHDCSYDQRTAASVLECRKNCGTTKAVPSFRLKLDGNQLKKPVIDSNTYVRSEAVPRHKRMQYKVDSGYLSSDSAGTPSSRRKAVRRAGAVAVKLPSGSDSDESENEARSESGAESVETHSVFFGSLRKFSLNPRDADGSFDSRRSGFQRASSKKLKHLEKNRSKIIA